MAGLIDALISQYGNGSSNPYATQQASAPAPTPASEQSAPVSISSLIDLLGRSANNPYAGQGGPGALNPHLAAQAQQDVASYQAPSAAATADRQGVGQSAPVAQAPTRSKVAQPNLNDITQASVPNFPVAQVDTNSSFPSASDYGDSSQAGGLLGSLAGAASDAATDPGKSKGFLNSVGDALSGAADKLRNMSPGASQGLLAAGMSMLANNDGRHNLAQLVGDGGIAGLNAYQQVNLNRIAAAKNMYDIQHMRNADVIAAQNAGTEAYKAQHPFLTVAPGDNVFQPGAAGSPAAEVASGGVKAAGTQDVMQSDGSVMTFKTDVSGKPIPGTGVISKDPNVGPLPPDQLKVVNDAATKATSDQHALAQTQTMLTKLQSTDIPAGLKAKGQDLWTQITGDQNAGQVLRNQLMQQTYQDYLATWKPGIGGRLTNTDVQLLKSGMPPDTASSGTWTKFLTSYGKLQSDVADQSTRAAAFANANRGQLTSLTRPLTIGGVTYPAGTSYPDVVMGRGGTAAQQSGQNGTIAGYSIADLQAEARRRGLLNGN